MTASAGWLRAAAPRGAAAVRAEVCFGNPIIAEVRR
jgi:hypothetical protein